MSRAPWIAALALVVFGVAWGFGRLAPSEPDPPRSAAPKRRQPATPRAPAPAATPVAAEPAAVAWRDLFTYADGPAPRSVVDPALAPTVDAPPAPLLTPTPEPPVRWVGFVRRGAELRAALADHGVVVVVGVGDSVDGRRVVAIDEDRGARLRAADGREEWLAPER